MELKELTVSELSSGYYRSKETGQLTCIFCGEAFEEGLIYNSRGRNVTAQRAIAEHIFDRHGGVFHGLIQLDKQINGLSELHISTATVRTHKFNIQKTKRQAQILLAILAQIEDEELVAARKQLSDESAEKAPIDFPKPNQDFCRNTLHPFFTTFDLK